MNMTNQLEDRIRISLHELAETTTVSPDARFGHRTAPVVEIRPDRHRWFMPAAAAVAGLALVGGLIALNREEPGPASTSEQPLPEPVPVNTIAVPLYEGVPALFPPANSSEVFPTPEAAVGAYLRDRTGDEVLPHDLTGGLPDDEVASAPKLPMSFSLVQTNPTMVESDDANETATAAVEFSLQTTDDSGDGLALVRQIAPAGQPEQWVVTAAGVASFGIDEVTFEAGHLTGSFTSEVGGRTEVMVFDAATGELLDSSAFPGAGLSPDDSPVPNTDLIAPAAVGDFEFDGLAVDTVTVRFWNTNAQPDGHPVAVFAETAVARGSTVRDQGRPAVQLYVDSVPPAIFDNGPITTFADLGTTGSVLIFNDIVNRETDTARIRGEIVEITARRQDTATPYCVDLALAGRPGTACFDFDQIARQSIGFNLDSADGSLVLVGSIVTDAAASVTAPDGREIIPVGNVWYDLIPSSTGEAGTYTITTADGGTATQQLG